MNQLNVIMQILKSLQKLLNQTLQKELYLIKYQSEDRFMDFSKFCEEIFEGTVVYVLDWENYLAIFVEGSIGLGYEG